METLKRRLNAFELGSPEERSRVNTFAWVEFNPTDSNWPAKIMPPAEALKKAGTKIPANAHVQTITPFSQFAPQAANFPAYIDINPTFEGQDDVIYIQYKTLTLKDLPAGHSIFPLIWRSAPMKSEKDLSSATYPLKGHSYHYLKHSPQFEEFLGLPDMASSKVIPQRYLSGVGDNVFGESIAHVVDHPLKHVLACLPQCLALGGALREWNEAEPEAQGVNPDPYFSTVDRIGDGTVRPWSYAGTYLSLFTLHREDACLPSANLHIGGASKIWIAITEEGMKMINDLFIDNIKPCFTHHRSIFIHPNFLIRHNIPFNVAFQQPGDLILSDSLGAHEGWNAGENCALACNYIDSHTVSFLASQLFHPTRPSTGIWPCVCGTERRPCIKPDKKKRRLPADWFDFEAAYHEDGTRHLSVQRSVMQWIQVLNTNLNIDPQLLLQSASTPNPEAVPAFWCHAHRRCLQDMLVD
jgi:hypothetical protein